MSDSTWREIARPGDFQSIAQKIWIKSGGKGWEPTDPNDPLVLALIAAGFLRRSDGRCGFERFKDSHVVWTDAARLAFADENAAG